MNGNNFANNIKHTTSNIRLLCLPISLQLHNEESLKLEYKQLRLKALKYRMVDAADRLFIESLIQSLSLLSKDKIDMCLNILNSMFKVNSSHCVTILWALCTNVNNLLEIPNFKIFLASLIIHCDQEMLIKICLRLLSTKISITISSIVAFLLQYQSMHSLSLLFRYLQKSDAIQKNQIALQNIIARFDSFRRMLNASSLTGMCGNLLISPLNDIQNSRFIQSQHESSQKNMVITTSQLLRDGISLKFIDPSKASVTEAVFHRLRILMTSIKNNMNFDNNKIYNLDTNYNYLWGEWIQFSDQVCTLLEMRALNFAKLLQYALHLPKLNSFHDDCLLWLIAQCSQTDCIKVALTHEDELKTISRYIGELLNRSIIEKDMDKLKQKPLSQLISSCRLSLLKRYCPNDSKIFRTQYIYVSSIEKQLATFLPTFDNNIRDLKSCLNICMTSLMMSTYVTKKLSNIMTDAPSFITMLPGQIAFKGSAIPFSMSYIANMSAVCRKRLIKHFEMHVLSDNGKAISPGMMETYARLFLVSPYLLYENMLKLRHRVAEPKSSSFLLHSLIELITYRLYRLYSHQCYLHWLFSVLYSRLKVEKNKQLCTAIEHLLFIIVFDIIPIEVMLIRPNPNNNNNNNNNTASNNSDNNKTNNSNNDQINNGNNDNNNNDNNNNDNKKRKRDRNSKGQTRNINNVNNNNNNVINNNVNNNNNNVNNNNNNVNNNNNNVNNNNNNVNNNNNNTALPQSSHKRLKLSSVVAVQNPILLHNIILSMAISIVTPITRNRTNVQSLLFPQYDEDEVKQHNIGDEPLNIIEYANNISPMTYKFLVWCQKQKTRYTCWSKQTLKYMPNILNRFLPCIDNIDLLTWSKMKEEIDGDGKCIRYWLNNQTFDSEQIKEIYEYHKLYPNKRCLFLSSIAYLSLGLSFNRLHGNELPLQRIIKSFSRKSIIENVINMMDLLLNFIDQEINVNDNMNAHTPEQITKTSSYQNDTNTDLMDWDNEFDEYFGNSTVTANIESSPIENKQITVDSSINNDINNMIQPRSEQISLVSDFLNCIIEAKLVNVSDILHCLMNRDDNINSFELIYLLIFDTKSEFCLKHKRLSRDCSSSNCTPFWCDDQFFSRQINFHNSFLEIDMMSATNPLPVYYSNDAIRILPLIDILIRRLIENLEIEEHHERLWKLLIDIIKEFSIIYHIYHHQPITFVRDILYYYDNSISLDSRLRKFLVLLCMRDCNDTIAFSKQFKEYMKSIAIINAEATFEPIQMHEPVRLLTPKTPNIRIWSPDIATPTSPGAINTKVTSNDEAKIGDEFSIQFTSNIYYYNLLNKIAPYVPNWLHLNSYEYDNIETRSTAFYNEFSSYLDRALICVTTEIMANGISYKQTVEGLMSVLLDNNNIKYVEKANETPYTAKLQALAYIIMLLPKRFCLEATQLICEIILSHDEMVRDKFETLSNECDGEEDFSFKISNELVDRSGNASRCTLSIITTLLRIYFSSGKYRVNVQYLLDTLMELSIKDNYTFRSPQQLSILVCALSSVTQRGVTGRKMYKTIFRIMLRGLKQIATYFQIPMNDNLILNSAQNIQQKAFQYHIGFVLDFLSWSIGTYSSQMKRNLRKEVISLIKELPIEWQTRLK